MPTACVFQAGGRCVPAAALRWLCAALICMLHCAALQDPAELAAAAIFDELVTLQEAGRLALVVADQRFPEEYEEPAQEGSWLA